MTDFTAALHFLRLNRFQRRQRRLKVQIKGNFYYTENACQLKEGFISEEVYCKYKHVSRCTDIKRKVIQLLVQIIISCRLGSASFLFLF